MPDVLDDVGAGGLKELGHLLLAQPHGLVEKRTSMRVLPSAVW